ncbi:MAG: lactate dehydrogenase [Gallionella sp.]|nr:lactate dehydrogenase [Gallionella sp.]MDD4946919.1 lactate dehydrogenase [Gallionella sp.]
MNAVEIESAISDLALQPFDAAEFPFAFLAAFGNNAVTIKKLRAGNASDLPGAVLQRNKIHLAVCDVGKVGDTLSALRTSPATLKAKVKFILATDGQTLEAEELVSGETVASSYSDFPNHFGFFLPLAGISTVKEIKDNPVDVRATGRLNKLYVELLKENPDWATAERRPDMNHFMARLVFCFFAEDTDIFNGEGLFTHTVEQMSERDGSNTHQVLSEVFRAMNIKVADRPIVQPRLPNYANGFPYVNGGLFSGSTEVPRFTRMARSYLIHAGNLDWQQINPDIFGSMIQAVADDEERGALGMHYTSVPNILKVLNPLFLDELREQLEAAGENKAKLLNLRKRMARIRVFDPACGSGNFLVIAYKQMREIEAEINRRRGESYLGSEIPLTNFRGIELRDFPAEIARLALIIAEFQCDVMYRGQRDALLEFLPLSKENWIVCGNALRLDWLSICPPTGTGVKLVADDLFGVPLDQKEIDFENEGGETFICGNPPYVGSTVKPPKGASKEIKERLKMEAESRKSDLEALFAKETNSWKSLDYVSGWFMQFSKYAKATRTACAFVSTNSVMQGEQVARLWPLVLGGSLRINFAFTSFKWANLATKNAAVTVVIVGLSGKSPSKAALYEDAGEEGIKRRDVDNINAYLIPYRDVYVEARSGVISEIKEMTNGSKPADGGHLIISSGEEAREMIKQDPHTARYIRPLIGTEDTIHGDHRYCLWINACDSENAMSLPLIKKRTDAVIQMRSESLKELTKEGAATPYAFQQIRQRDNERVILVPRVSSESREYLPISYFQAGAIVVDGAFGLFNAELWNFALLVSKLHLVWIATVCGKLKTDFRYSNTLGWNTFPVPRLTEQNKADLTACAEAILLAREAHFPATIADLYDPDTMPDNLRHAHERNDEVLERIYIGRRFRNDTERLEKLFELYTKMTAAAKAKPAVKATRGKKHE